MAWHWPRRYPRFPLLLSLLFRFLSLSLFYLYSLSSTGPRGWRAIKGGPADRARPRSRCLRHRAARSDKYAGGVGIPHSAAFRSLPLRRRHYRQHHRRSFARTRAQTGLLPCHYSLQCELLLSRAAASPSSPSLSRNLSTSSLLHPLHLASRRSRARTPRANSRTRSLLAR